MALSALNRRRLRNFRRNRRAFWSLMIFSVLFLICLPAEFIANEKPVLVKYRGEFFMPIFNFYPETAFGGEFETEAIYRDPEVQCLIATGGAEACIDDPEAVMADAADGKIGGEKVRRGWMIWPLVPYSYNTPVEHPGAAPLPPNIIGFYAGEGGERAFGFLPEDQRGQNLLGTDHTKRDVLARVIYGFRLSILFTLIVTALASVVGIVAGAVQGYFGGLLDLVFQRIIEIWSSVPSIYVIIILFAILGVATLKLR